MTSFLNHLTNNVGHYTIAMIVSLFSRCVHTFENPLPLGFSIFDPQAATIQKFQLCQSHWFQ